MLPIPQNGPPRGLNSPVVPTIPLYVGPDLGPPPIAVPLGHRPMLGARVPEASIKKHGDSRSRELEVRPRFPGVGNRPVHPEPQTAGMDGTAHSHLERSIPTRGVPHPATRRGIGYRPSSTGAAASHRSEHSGTRSGRPLGHKTDRASACRHLRYATQGYARVLLVNNRKAQLLGNRDIYTGPRCPRVHQGM